MGSKTREIHAGTSGDMSRSQTNATGAFRHGIICFEQKAKALGLRTFPPQGVPLSSKIACLTLRSPPGSSWPIKITHAPRGVREERAGSFLPVVVTVSTVLLIALCVVLPSYLVQ